MTISELFRILQRRWVLIGAILATVLVGAVGLTAISPTMYQATSTLFVSFQAESGAGDLQVVQSERIDSYAELVSRDSVLQAVIQELDLDRSPSSLRGDVTVASPQDSVLIEITVRDRDAEDAAAIANAIGEEAVLLVEELETREGRGQSPIEVSLAEPAQVPQAAASPNLTRNMLYALVMGLGLAVGAAIVRETLDTRVRDPEALRDQLGLPLLATVEYDKRAKEQPLLLDKATLDADDGNQAQLGELWSRSTIVEEFRYLRTNLQFFDFESRSRSILVTSASPGDGKSTIAGDLAITMALAGEAVVLVDCDLRRPSLERFLGVQTRKGLTEVVIGRAELDSVLERHQNLSLLPVGTLPPNPSELLGSQAMADLLDELEGRFDAVVIDSPPASVFADPIVLAPLCGATLLVVRMGYTDQRELERALAALESAQAKVCGFVANRAHIRGRGRGYYGYSDDRRRGEEGLAPATAPLLRPRSFNGPTRDSGRSPRDPGAEGAREAEGGPGAPDS